jgi:MFS family permease
MTSFQPADNLRSRTFHALLVAQFLAAFNDQAIHASAMFYAINLDVLGEARAISLMPILFYAPWAIFCTLAGYLADRYSKRHSLVFWKVAEVVITLVALAGFWVGRRPGQESLGVALVLSTVFLMGMHSAFFVPAKYGAMPEILTDRMLSRGNGILESLSFLAVILGTVAGGVLSSAFRGREFVIGIILVSLAVVGALASLFIRRMPAANPTRPFPAYVYGPLWPSIRALLRTRTLVFAVVGIAFFTFLVAFMRSTVYMHGQAQKVPWSEKDTSLIVGMVALGIGVGSPLVGFLSGGKVEVGLVPVGAVGMVLATTVAALLLANVPVLVGCIVLMGFFTGFYLVPLFTLLQHRAPRTSKGDAVATSNFINVTGAILASVVFFTMDWTARHTGIAPPLPESASPFRGELAARPELEEGRPHRVVVGGREFVAHTQSPPYALLKVGRRLKPGDEVVVRTYALEDVTYYRVRRAGAEPRPVYNMRGMPRLLFLSVGALTLLTLGLLWRLLPDLFVRTALWFRSLGRYRVEVAGMSHLPGTGPVLLVTDAPAGEACGHVHSATDRVTEFVPAEEGFAGREEAGETAAGVLGRGEVAGLPLGGLDHEAELDKFLGDLAARAPAPVLPVHYEVGQEGRVYVVAGAALPAGTSARSVREELGRLRFELGEKLARGEPLEEAAGH